MSAHANRWGPSSPVSTDRHPVAQEFVGHVELLVLGVLAHTLEVLQLDSQNHVFGFRQEVDLIVAQPELTSAAEERAKPSDRDGLQAVCTLVRSMIVDIKSTETKVRSRVFFFQPFREWLGRLFS